jgi:integrase
VSTITVDDVERLINTVKEHKGIRGGTLSNRRANIILDVLRLILDRAVVRGWLSGNPARAVSKLREDRAEIDPFSFTEVKTLLEKGLLDLEDRRYFTMAFFAGLRPSEQIAAEWEAVDWVTTPPCLGVMSAITARGGRGRTKTPGSKRYVELLPVVQQALQDQRAASQLKSAFIFPSRTGKARDITNLRERVWKPALRRAKLRYRTMYQTRHTFATLALQSGEQIGWVSKQLGHTTDEMVIRHYAKFIPNLTRQDGSALARVMREQGLG